ncbi:hypothetical protein VTN02DRAFT_3960 [Thermoascus thermophilus]
MQFQFQFTSLALLLLSATALAAPEPVEKRQDVTDLPSPTGFSIQLPPASILSVLETAVPASVLTDADARASLISDIQAGSTPGWVQSLPPDVKSYISTAYVNPAAATATGVTATGTAATTATATGSSGSASPGATSTGGAGVAAAAPTGAIAAGLAGAAGILGLAIAL